MLILDSIKSISDKNQTKENEKSILTAINHLLTSELDGQKISLYRSGNNYYLVTYKGKQVAKLQKISRVYAHIKFPNLLVR
jgi:hypothetical protein